MVDGPLAAEATKGNLFDRVAVVREGQRLGVTAFRAASLVASATVLAAVIALYRGSPSSWSYTLPVLAALPAIAFGLPREHFFKRRTAHVRIDDGAIVLDERVLARAGEITDVVYCRASEDGGFVQLFESRHRRLVDIYVRSDDEARALLAAARVSGEARTNFILPFVPDHVRKLTPLVPALLAPFVSMSGQLGAAGNLLPIAILVAASVAARVALTRMRVGLYREGIVVSRWREREIAWDDLIEVAPSGAHGLVVRARGQTDLRLTMGDALDLVGSTFVPRRDAIVAAIERALAAHRELRASYELAARLMRGARRPAEWIEHLRALRDERGDYRSAALRDDDLWLVLEDDGAPADARAAAALLLGRTGDHAARDRFRVAASTADIPRLRIALETAADASDVDLVEHAVAAVPATHELRSDR